ncbi:MAG: cytochrome c [Anaerolineae bacterium]
MTRALPLRRYFVSGLLGCLALGVVSCGALSRSATPEPRPALSLATLPASIGPRDVAEFFPTELASVERGRVVFEKLCEECHGEGGQGDGVRSGQLGIRPSDLTDPAVRDDVPLSWYFRSITNGVVGTAMLGWKSQLIEQQRWDVTFYTWSLASSAESIVQGRELYGQLCAACHGSNGLGDGPRAGTLEQPATPLADPRYLAGRSGDELLEAITGDVTSPDHDWSDELTKDEQRSIINYLWTFLYH